MRTIGVSTARDWLATIAPPLALLAALVLAWEIYVNAFDLSSVTLPAPSHVLDSAFANRDVLWHHSLVTLRETLIGLGVSIVLAVALALGIDLFAPARRALYPLLVASQTIPIVAIAPLLVIWFGFDLTPKILVVTLYTFFPITVAFASGLAATDRDALALMRTLGASRLQTLRLLRVPGALPQLFTGLRIAVSYAVVAAVFAEWVGAVEGLGIYVVLMKNSFRTDLVFAAVFIIAGMSLALFAAVVAIEKAVLRGR